MNLIRKYKISKITNQPLTGVEGEIISFIKDWLTDLDVVKLDKYPNKIFWFKGKSFVLEQDSTSDFLWVRHRDFWEVLETKYLIKYTDIQIIIKYLVKEVFKEEVKTPSNTYRYADFLVEEALKEEVKTPLGDFGNTGRQVEEAFKEQVKTLHPYKQVWQELAEESFKKQKY